MSTYGILELKWLTVFKAILLQQVKGGFPDLIQWSPVSNWLIACQYLENLDAPVKNVTLLLWCQLVSPFMRVPVETNVATKFNYLCYVFLETLR